MPKLESPRKSRPNPHKAMLSLRDVGRLGKSYVGKVLVNDQRPGSGRKGRPLGDAGPIKTVVPSMSP